MRKERKSPKGLLLAVLLTAGVLGGAYYAAVIRPAANAEPAETTWTTLTADSAPSPTPPSSSPFPAPSKSVGSSTPSARTDKIIQCHDPEIGDFYTNATSCEAADPHNRLSIAESVETTPGQDRYSGQNYTTPEQNAGNSRTDRKPTQIASSEKPNLRLHGKSPPPGLPPECRFPVGKALEIERSLSAANDPYQSKWRDSYCQFRCEARKERCAVADDYFYYSDRSMCRGTEHEHCTRFVAN